MKSSVASSSTSIFWRRRAFISASHTLDSYEGKLRELRFYLGPSGDAVRISYYVATGRRIILLTVFKKRRRRERAEIDRAEQAMRRCIKEKHEPEDDADA